MSAQKSVPTVGMAPEIAILRPDHEYIQDAVSKIFPNVPWQRCQFHFSKNISEKAPKKYQAGIRAELQEM